MSAVRVFVENEPDDLHCLQACYMMVHEALTGELVALKTAEERTGFVAGWPTWQFALLDDFARRGFPTLDVEQFDPAEFVEDPRGTIRKQVDDDEVAAEVLSSMDVDREAERLTSCLANPLVALRNRTPDLDHLTAALENGAFVLCNVNGHRLHGKDGYLGHLVIVESLTDDRCFLQDPGLPSARDMVISRDDFAAAWMYPSPTMANFYAIFPTRAAWESALAALDSLPDQATAVAEG